MKALVRELLQAIFIDVSWRTISSSNGCIFFRKDVAAWYAPRPTDRLSHKLPMNPKKVSDKSV